MPRLRKEAGVHPDDYTKLSNKVGPIFFSAYIVGFKKPINTMKNLSLILFTAILAVACSQEKCWKEYIECRDNCYEQADQVREQWSAAMDDCRNQFDQALQQCFELADDEDFMECYRNANAARNECEAEADRAYDEGMAEVRSCVEDCKTKLENCN